MDADTLASNSVTAAKLQSGSVIQSVTKMGTACYNMTNTSWGTELSTDFRVTLPTVQASNSKILILFCSSFSFCVMAQETESGLQKNTVNELNKAVETLRSKTEDSL